MQRLVGSTGPPATGGGRARPGTIAASKVPLQLLPRGQGRSPLGARRPDRPRHPLLGGYLRQSPTPPPVEQRNRYPHSPSIREKSGVLLDYVWAQRVSLSLFFLAAAAPLCLAYQGPFVIHFIDQQYPYNPPATVWALQYSWSNTNLGETSSVNIFSLPSTMLYLGAYYLGSPPWLAQFSFNLVALWMSGFGMFIFLRHFSEFSKKNTLLLGAGICSIFYMFNMVATQVYYWDFIPIGPLFQAALPFQALLLSRGLQIARIPGGQFPYGHAVGVAGLSIFTLGANEPLAVGAGLVLVTVAAYGVIDPFRLCVKKKIGFLLLSTAASIGINAYWLIAELSQASGGIINEQALQNLNDYLFFTSRLSPLYGLELRGIQTGNFMWYSSLYNGPGIGALLLLPLVMLMLIPLLVLKALRPVQRMQILATVAMLLLAVAAFAGAGGPLGVLGLNPVLTSPTALQLIRNTANAIGPALSFLMACMFLYGAEASLILGHYVMSLVTAKPRPIAALSRLDILRRNRSGGRATSAFAVPVASLAIVALVSSSVVPYIVPGVSGWLIAGTPYQSRESVPAYETETARYINQHAGSTYTMLVPGGFQEQNWTGYGGRGYLGYDVLSSLITTPIIFSDGGGLSGNPNFVIREAYASAELGSTMTNFTEILTKLRVGYLVVEGGLGAQYPWGIRPVDNTTRIVGFLEGQRGLQLVQTLGLNWIFQNSLGIPSLISTGSAISPLNGLGSNITQTYANASSHLPYPSATPPVFLSETGAGTLSLSVSRSLQLAGLPSPGYPITFNVVPLSISVNQFPTLKITFTTSKYTAAFFSISDANSLTYDAVKGSLLSTWQYSTPGPNVGPNDGWYYSPSEPTTVSINLQTALIDEAGPATSGMVNYLAIQLWPTGGNATEQAHTTPANTQNLSISIQSLTIQPALFSGTVLPIIHPAVEVSSKNITANYFYGVNGQSNHSLRSPIPLYNTTSGPAAVWNESWSGRNLTYPGFPIIYNNLPVNASLSSSHYLVAKIRTSPGSSVVFAVSSEANISKSLWGSEWASARGSTYPASNNGTYATNGDWLTIAIDLQSALRGQDDLLKCGNSCAFNFLSVQLIAQASARIVHFQVSAMALTDNIQVSGSNVSIPGTTAEIFIPGIPFAFNESSSIATSNPTMQTRVRPAVIESYSEISPISYTLTLASPSGYPFALVFSQSFNPLWSISSDPSHSAGEHFLANGYANGWFFPPCSCRGNFTLSIKFLGQAALDDGEVITAATLVSLVGIMIFSYPPLLAAVLNLTRARKRGSS